MDDLVQRQAELTRLYDFTTRRLLDLVAEALGHRTVAANRELINELLDQASDIAAQLHPLDQALKERSEQIRREHAAQAEAARQERQRELAEVTAQGRARYQRERADFYKREA
jgi:hypothetical protein